MRLILIKLTTAYAEPAIYINVDTIVSLVEEKQTKKTCVALNNGTNFFVIETVEEILAKINKTTSVKIVT